MKKHHKTVSEKGIHQSMSRKGNCLDNSIMEGIFRIVKNEMFYEHECEFETLEEWEKEMKAYIHYYNHERIKTKVKGLTPVQYRNQSLVSVIASKYKVFN